MNHNEIARVCRQIVVEAFQFRSEDQIPIDPWDRIIFEFAHLYNGVNNANLIRKAFRPVLEAVR